MIGDIFYSFKVLLIFSLFFLELTQAKAQVSQQMTQAETPSLSQLEDLYSQGKYQEISKSLWPQFDKLKRKELLLLAKTHLKLSEAEKSIKILNILISKNAKDYEAYFYLGNAHYLKSRQLKAGEEWKLNRQEAIDNYKKSLEIKKKYMPAYNGLTQLYEFEKNVYELRQIYRDLIEIDGEKFEWLIKLCEIDTHDSIYDTALKNCEKATKIQPNDPRASVFYAQSLIGMGKNDEGKVALKKVALKFKKSDLANSAYGNLLVEEKNYQDAFKYYSLAVAANSKSFEAWLGYAKSAFEIQKFKEALSGFINACNLNKDALPDFKKSTNILRNNSNMSWTLRYEQAAERCGLRK